ncbi:MAG: Ig-like domain-containing protein, partial [Actinomycetota bacterium]
VSPGVDGDFGNADDVLEATIDTGAFGATDTEDPEYDADSGDLFVLSGSDTEIYRVTPNGADFTTGGSLQSQFNIPDFGPGNFEGLASAPDRDSLYIGGNDQIIEMSYTGQEVRIIDLSGIGAADLDIGGLAVGPASSGVAGEMSFWIVDRGAGNTNDGRLFEVSAPDINEPLPNLPPVVEAGDDQTVVFDDGAGNATASLDATVDDDGGAENLTLQWEKTSGQGTVTFADDTSAATTATFSSPGVYQLQLTATDADPTEPLSASDTLTVTVENAPNDPPTIDPIADQAMNEGENLVIDLDPLLDDPEGDPLHVSVDGLPGFGSFDDTTNEITFSPTTGDHGSYGPFTVTVTDVEGAGAVPEFQGAASNSETGLDASTLTIDQPAGTEEGDLLVAQIRYRGDFPELTAPEGWIELGTIPGDSQDNHTVLYKFAGSSEPSSYTFDQNLDDPQAGRMAGGIGAFSDVDPVYPFDVWDATINEVGSTTTPDVVTTVDNTRVLRMWGWQGAEAATAGTNVPPAGVDQRWSEQDGSTATDRNRVLAGDHVQELAGSTGTSDATGASGEDLESGFTVALNPLEGGMDSTSFNLDVNAVPVANDDSATTDEDVAVDIDVRANDSDADQPLTDLTVEVVSDPANGSLALLGDGVIRYTPNLNFNGEDTFTYQVNDGTALSNEATVTVTVDPVNDAPVANDDSVPGLANTPLDIDVLANDTDVDGDDLIVASITQPDNGSVAVAGDSKSVTYTPDPGFDGEDTFTYLASDGVAPSNEATVTVNLDNEAPVAGDDNAQTHAGDPVNIDVLDNDSDPDGHDLSVQNLSNPANGSVVLESDDTITYTPDPGFAGVDTFTYEATDGVDSDEATVTVTVTNTAPEAEDDSATTEHDTEVTIDVLANDSDADGDSLEVTDLTQPDNGSVSVEADESVTYTPDAGFSGSDTFTYRASDGVASSNVATVTVMVEEPDPDPDPDPTDWFLDDDGHIFEDDINAIADAGITRGCNPPQNDLFCPDDTVTRGQMAAFLVRALGYTDDGGGDLFTDDDGHVFEGDIDLLAAAGVTRGCNPPQNDEFCPDDELTRGQMAAFLVRALGYTDDGGGDLFVDDDDSVFESDIDRLATAGVTRGCNPPANDRFCPDQPLTRGQMAAFLARALLYGG